ncbi:MAG: hypothetical protein HDS95_00985 [Bacteroidales bacterium]|nr:hypothetical protein [Bacteroidales bacterium]
MTLTTAPLLPSMQIYNQSERSNVAICGDDDVARNGGKRRLSRTWKDVGSKRRTE